MAARVLVIDDNLDLATNLADILEGARELEVSVTCAPEGQSGVRAAEREGFDVAIVDVKLPDATGVDLIRPLRAASPLGEIILITGFATVDTAIRPFGPGRSLSCSSPSAPKSSSPRSSRRWPKSP